VTCRSAPFHFLPHQSLVLRHCLTGVPKAHNLSTTFGASRALEPISNHFLSISVLKPRHVFKQSSFIYSKRLGLGLQGRLSSQEPLFHSVSRSFPPMSGRSSCHVVVSTLSKRYASFPSRKQALKPSCFQRLEGSCSTFILEG
jgi:hypothetical protein